MVRFQDFLNNLRGIIRIGVYDEVEIAAVRDVDVILCLVSILLKFESVSERLCILLWIVGNVLVLLTNWVYVGQNAFSGDFEVEVEIHLE